MALGLSGHVAAQEPSLPPLAEDEIELSADVMRYDENSDIVTAQGNVVVLHDNYELHADKVTYNQTTGVVAADGKIKIRDPQGNILSADKIELTDTLKEGFIDNVHLLMNDGSRVAAINGRRHGDKTEFSHAVYSPCEVCSEKDEPLWQIKAVRVVHDQGKKRLYYHDAYLEAFGVPIFYTPWFSHPDPTVNKATGFLLPQPRQSPELGLVMEAPFFWNIAPHMDATLKPIITSNEGLVLAGDWRHHLGFGQYKLEGSVTYTDERNDLNQKTGERVFRGHIFSDGVFSHTESSRSRYNIRWASDDTYLRRYDFSNEDTLRSQYVYENFMGRSYLSAQGLMFQGLRIEDVTGLTPFALPNVNFYHETDPLWRGGRVKTHINALALTRTDGMDTQRLSGQTAFVLPHIFENGVIAQTTASLRGDVYQVSDADRPDSPAFTGENGTTGRFLPRAAMELRWPLINNLGRFTQTLEPIVTLVAAADGGNPSAIPNEDSRAFDLDDNNLFSLDRFPGLDRWEGGARATYGGRWGLLGRDFDIDVLLGQSYRFDEDAAVFPDGSGLSGHFSDLVGRVGLNIKNWVQLTHRFRIDKNDLAIRRNEFDALFGNEKYMLDVGYLKLDRDLDLEDLQNREEIRLSGRVRLSKKWSLTGGTIQDLSHGRDPIFHSLGLIYSDECLEFRLNYRKNFTADRDFEPGTTIMLRIRLKNLG